MAMYFSLSSLRAMLVPAVGSPWSSKTVTWILRPSMPPFLFHSAIASLAPLASQSPSGLSCPLWALTTAILIGSELSASSEPELPGALQAAVAARTMPAGRR